MADLQSVRVFGPPAGAAGWLLSNVQGIKS